MEKRGRTGCGAGHLGHVVAAPLRASEQRRVVVVVAHEVELCVGVGEEPGNARLVARGGDEEGRGASKGRQVGIGPCGQEHGDQLRALSLARDEERSAPAADDVRILASGQERVNFLETATSAGLAQRVPLVVVIVVVVVSGTHANGI